MTGADDESLAILLNQTVSEISNRTSIQYNTALAALAGLGVVAAQIKNIQDRHIPIVYFAVAIAFGFVGLFQLEQDRFIALLGSYRRKLELLITANTVDPTTNKPVEGWEDFRRRHSTSGFARAAANSSRYFLTFGSAISFGVVFFDNATSNDYTVARSGLVVVAAVFLVIVVDMVLGIGRDADADGTP